MQDIASLMTRWLTEGDRTKAPARVGPLAAKGGVYDMRQEALAQLADAWGIERNFLDYKKDPVAISFEARSRVLSLMRDAPQDEQALVRKLQEARSAMLSPCLVFSEGQERRFTARLPQGEKGGVSLSARITQEDGSVTHCSVRHCCPEIVETTDHKAESDTCELVLESALPQGYHHLSLVNRTTTLAETFLYITPVQAFQPQSLGGGQRLFGLSIQLYTLRSSRNWGMGDFTDLQTLIRDAAAEGVDVIGVNPLHALFPGNPLHFSPYSPSNRAFLNVMYIDPEATEEYASCAAARELVASNNFQQRLAQLRETRGVDYEGVAAAKGQVLELLFDHFCDRELAHKTERAAAFQKFCESRGEALRLHASYDCLHEHFLRRDPDCWGWPVWPEAYRHPSNAAVQKFAKANADRARYFCFLQWLAQEQLMAAQDLSRVLGMGVGLYVDLAVGVDMNGSEVWSNQEAFALEASAGAPPDELARSGQDWGFPPLCPRMLACTGYALFAQNLRANMALCGAVRYDHAVSLLRLWWIPKERSASDGAYVRYDLEAMLGILALESQRHECLVIGEDLGTVPDLLTERLQARNIYSYRVLYFEKTTTKLLGPQEYPREATATITTHDLPTLASWWDGSDIDLRARLGLLGTDAVVAQMLAERAQDREHLLHALHEAGCWDGLLSAEDFPDLPTELNIAVHRFLSRSRSGVMIAQLEDLMEMLTPVNVPGTFRGHRNWQRKLRYPIEGLFERPAARAICAAMREERQA